MKIRACIRQCGGNTIASAGAGSDAPGHAASSGAINLLGGGFAPKGAARPTVEPKAHVGLKARFSVAPIRSLYRGGTGKSVSLGGFLPLARLQHCLTSTTSERPPTIALRSLADDGHGYRVQGWDCVPHKALSTPADRVKLGDVKTGLCLNNRPAASKIGPADGILRQSPGRIDRPGYPWPARVLDTLAGWCVRLKRGIRK